MSEEVIVSQAIQDSFVYLVITDTKFLSMVREVAKPEYFSSEITETIIRTCYAYYDQFKEAPKHHLQTEIGRRIANLDEEEQRYYLEYLSEVSRMAAPNRDYIIKTMSDFIKSREFSIGAIEFAKMVEKGNFAEARELMHSVLRKGVESYELGLVYLSNGKPTYYGDKSKFEVLLPTGIPLIDRSIKGLHRGQFVCILGGYKGKKSWACVHLGKRALIQGLKVLHLSHEMTMGDVEMRYDMAFGSLSSQIKPNHVELIRRNESGQVKHRERFKPKSVFNSDAVKKTRRIIKRFGGELIIKKYPMGTCTMGEMDRFLDYLQLYENFIPDVLINDYVEIMDLPLNKNAAMRDRINQAYIEHKRIADERNILVITVSQVTRAALRKEKLNQKDFAEDIRKLGNVDLVMAISQSDKQAQEDEMMVWVMANRSGPQDFGCMMSQNITIGQFCIDTWKIKDEADVS